MPCELLGRHVTEGADNRHACGSSRLPGRTYSTEVDQGRRAVGAQEHVRGFDVAVDDRRCPTVQIGQHVEQSDRDLMDFLLAEHRARLHPLQERRRLDVLLHDVVGGRLLFALEILDDSGNAGMLEPSQHHGLALEELEVLPVGEVRDVQLLDNDLPVLLQVGAEQRARGRPLADH